MRATELLKSDHRAVEHLLVELEAMPHGDKERRQQTLDKIADDLEIHSKIEEEIFYPALKKVSKLVGEAEKEHDKIETAIAGVEGLDPASTEFGQKLLELKHAIQHHVAEEEGPMFRDAEKLGDTELQRLGHQLDERKETLKSSMVHRAVRRAKLGATKIA